jgi:hypothetical protein
MKSVLKIALCSAALSTAPLFAQQAFNEKVENVGANCPVTLPNSITTANSKLPDPFKKLDGARISSSDEWLCRRQEILKLAERTVYGTKPPKPTSVTGTVSNTSISVSVNEGGKTGTFSVSVSLPATGTAPYPAIIRYGNSGADDNTIKGQGVAVINYTPTSVGGETGNRSKSGMFYDIYGTSSKTGTLAAWAWGVSRIIDVIEQSGGAILKADAIGVTGCSRYGKGPFAAGALDQRVALTIPVEGGTGGVAILRGAAKESGAQSPSNAFGEQPWLGDDFSSFQNNINNLPIDMHEVVGMIAPRGLLVLDKPGAADWLASRSGYASAMAGSEVYKALGFGGNITYHSNNTSGSHCAWINEWKTPVEDNIKRFLLKTQTPPSAPVINPRSDRTETMSNWIDWTTPSLTGSTGTVPSSSSGSSSSEATQSSSSEAKAQATTCKTPLITYPASAPPSDPYTACFQYANGKCYVCKVENEQGNNTCASGWVWNGSQIESNLESGYWYQEVDCPAASNSSSELSSSSEPSSSSSSEGISPIIVNSQSPIINSQIPIYYSLQGTRLGSAKPSKPGIYIVKEGYSVKKTVVK